MDINIAYTVGIFLYLAVTVGIALFAARRELQSSSDFQVGGRRLNSVMLFFTLFATIVGAASVMGYTGWYWRRGLSQLWFLVGMIAVYFVFIYYLGPRISRFGFEKSGVTPANWLEYRYNKATGYIGSVMLIIAYLAITAFQYMAMATILSMVTGLSYNLCCVIAALIVIAYTSLGGFWAVAWTDTLQGAMTILGLLILMPILIVKAGGVGTIFSSVPAEHLSLTGYITPGTAITWMLVFFLGIVSWPDIWQRCFAAKSEKSMKKSFWFYIIAVVILMGIVILLIGFAGKVLLPEFEGSDRQILPTLVMQHTPLLLGIIIMASLLAVIMGTADSTLLISAVMIVKDFYQGLIRPDASDEQVLKVSKLVTVITGLVVLVISLVAPSLFNIWIMSADITGATLAVPILLGFFWKKPSGVAGLASVIAGFIGWLISYLGWQPLGLGPVIIGAVFSLITYIATASIKPAAVPSETT